MKSINVILFLVVAFLANIIQGITGFAGTVLAMPFSVMFVGFENAKPVLNVLGILSGIYVLVLSYKHLNKKEFIKITAVMSAGIAAGIFIKRYIPDSSKLLYIILGAVVIATGTAGFIKSLKKNNQDKIRNKAVLALLLVCAGAVHGLFVCGGPLLVSYLTGKITDKNEFRSTVSAVWVVLNSIILIDDIRTGLWNVTAFKLLIPSAAVLFAGLFIGALLCRKMSRELFMKITYALLIISGASLLFR